MANKLRSKNLAHPRVFQYFQGLKKKINRLGLSFAILTLLLSIYIIGAAATQNEWLLQPRHLNQGIFYIVFIVIPFAFGQSVASLAGYSSDSPCLAFEYAGIFLGILVIVTLA